MKKVFLSMVVCLLVITFSCDKANEELPVNDVNNEAVSLPDVYLEDDKIPEEIELTDEYLSDEDADAVRKYCVWEVTDVKCPEGKEPKFKVGDKICYRCDDNGCTADRGIIIISDGGRNFGDGCRTYGKTVDTECKERDDCAGKYIRR
jgi:hypothetical protein